jgi:ATP synthase protein I
MADSPGTLRALGQLSTVGMSFVLALVLGFGGGFWLDGWLGTKPWLSFIGFFAGLAGGVLNVYRVLQATASPARSSTPAAGPPRDLRP